MKGKVSLLDFCLDTTTTFFKVYIPSYSDYLRSPVKEPIPKEIFDLYSNDTYLLRASLMIMWIYNYLTENNMMKGNGRQFGSIVSNTIARSYVRTLSALGFPEIYIDSKADKLRIDIKDITFEFLLSKDYSKSNKDIYKEFATYFCMKMFKKYNVSFEDTNTQATLASFVNTQLSVFFSLMDEWLKHYEIENP